MLVSTAVAVTVFGAGAVAGGLGSLLGIGGGIFLVPLLNLVLKLPIGMAAAVSLATVIATSSSVSAAAAGRRLINMRFGMTLEVATAAGSLLGGITAHYIGESTLQKAFGAVSLITAVMMLGRLNRRNVLTDPRADPGVLGGRYFE